MRWLTNDEMTRVLTVEDDGDVEPADGATVLDAVHFLRYTGGDSYTLLSTGGLLGSGDEETVLFTEANQEASVFETEAEAREAVGRDIWSLAMTMHDEQYAENVLLIGDVEELYPSGDPDVEWWVVTRDVDGTVTAQECDFPSEALGVAADAADAAAEQLDDPEERRDAAEAAARARLQLLAAESWATIIEEGDIVARYPEIPDTEGEDEEDPEYVVLRWEEHWYAVLDSRGDYRLVGSRAEAIRVVAWDVGSVGWPVVTWGDRDFVRAVDADLCYGVDDEAGWHHYETAPDAQRAAATMLEERAELLEQQLGDEPTVAARVTPHHLRRSAARLREAPSSEALGEIIREENTNGRIGRDPVGQGGITAVDLASLLGINRRWLYDTINGKGW